MAQDHLPSIGTYSNLSVDSNHGLNQPINPNNDLNQCGYIDVSNINPRYVETKSLPQKAWQGIKDNPWTTLKTILTIASYIILSVFSGGLSFGAIAGIYAGITLFSIVWNAVVAGQNGSTWTTVGGHAVLHIVIAAASFGFLSGAGEWLGNVLHPSVESFLTESVNFTVQNTIVPITDIAPHAICAGELVLSSLSMADENAARARSHEASVHGIVVIKPGMNLSEIYRALYQAGLDNVKLRAVVRTGDHGEEVVLYKKGTSKLCQLRNGGLLTKLWWFLNRSNRRTDNVQAALAKIFPHNPDAVTAITNSTTIRDLSFTAEAFYPVKPINVSSEAIEQDEAGSGAFGKVYFYNDRAYKKIALAEQVLHEDRKNIRKVHKMIYLPRSARILNIVNREKDEWINHSMLVRSSDGVLYLSSPKINGDLRSFGEHGDIYVVPNTDRVILDAHNKNIIGQIFIDPDEIIQKPTDMRPYRRMSTGSKAAYDLAPNLSSCRTKTLLEKARTTNNRLPI